MNRAHSKKSNRERRKGAAMLIVLMVLLMTTATATFAIHSTAMEIRASGYARQAMQAEYLAEGGTYAAVGYLDILKASGSITQYMQTRVGMNVASSPSEATVARTTNLLRIEMSDFNGAPGVFSPPVETDALRTPSFGPHNAYVPNFIVDGTDLYQVSHDDAGRDLTGRGAHYYRVTLTSLAQMAPPSDFHAGSEVRSYNEVAMRARAITEVGPYWVGGH